MALSALPSVDSLLSSEVGRRLVSHYGHRQVTAVIRATLSDIRRDFILAESAPPQAMDILATVETRLDAASTSSLRPLLNLTGTLLHTNLGRAPLPAEAIEAMARIAGQPSNLEFDLTDGHRGDRDAHIESLLTELTGAEAATLVNNNAAAVLLILNTLAEGKQVPVSRGELVEIGGSFRVPEIMTRAGCKLLEIGTTNRTHLSDYAAAMGPDTALIMKVHTSNYQIRGFTHSVPETELATLASEHGIPLVTDLGSGTLVDLTRFGLPAEPTVQGALGQGAHMVTFSGDKLLGGPQAGIIVGRRELVEKIKQNPMKRALRVDKLTIAALFEVLKLYRDPDSLCRRLPALRLLTRTPQAILEVARPVLEAIQNRLGETAQASIVPVESQIGSGSLPMDRLAGYAIAIAPRTGGEQALQRLARAFRSLPLPVIGRLHDGRLLLDLRTLEIPELLIRQLPELDP